MATFVFLPTLKRHAGGAAVLRALARALAESGREVVLTVLDERAPELEKTKAGADLPCPDLPCEIMPLGKAEPTKDDVWLAPEGWVNALAPGLQAGSLCLVYVQNHSMLFSSLPDGVCWNQLDVHFLAVSDPVARFIELFTGKYPPVLRPGVDLDRFQAPEAKPDGLRIGYMPRKNKALADQIRALFQHRNPHLYARFAPIDGLDAQGVATALAACHVFLCTGFPEGLGLPPLEAMASGCLCCGFTGFGGLDYMRQAGGDGPPRFKPWLPLRETDWTGNGLWCADADVVDAALCLEEAVVWLRSGDPRAAMAVEQARRTAASYGMDAFREQAAAIWEMLGR